MLHTLQRRIDTDALYFVQRKVVDHEGNDAGWSLSDGTGHLVTATDEDLFNFYQDVTSEMEVFEVTAEAPMALNHQAEEIVHQFYMQQLQNSVLVTSAGVVPFTVATHASNVRTELESLQNSIGFWTHAYTTLERQEEDGPTSIVVSLSGYLIGSRLDDLEGVLKDGIASVYQIIPTFKTPDLLSLMEAKQINLPVVDFDLLPIVSEMDEAELDNVPD